MAVAKLPEFQERRLARWTADKESATMEICAKTAADLLAVKLQRTALRSYLPTSLQSSRDLVEGPTAELPRSTRENSLRFWAVPFALNSRRDRFFLR